MSEEDCLPKCSTLTSRLDCPNLRGLQFYYWDLGEYSLACNINAQKSQEIYLSVKLIIRMAQQATKPFIFYNRG